MVKIDRRKNYFITVDTETSGDITNNEQLVYDIGWAVHDRKGNILEKRSFVVYETYCLRKDLMATAYYKNKLPQYESDIKDGKRKIAKWATIGRIFRKDCKDYNIKAIVAYNARFDRIATNNTEEYTTNGKYKYFYPYGIELWDSMKMASDTICKQKEYNRFCRENNFMTRHVRPRPQRKAETVYRYMTGDTDFIESHTGLEDVSIEVAIMAECFRQHKKMRKLLYA